MSIFYIQNNQKGEMPSLRSWLTNAFDSAADQEAPNSRERTRIYRTSNIAYRAGNKRGDAVSSVPMQILDPAGEPLPDTDPLVKGLLRNYRENMKRSELTLCFWGANLLVKRRAASGNLFELRWVNPNLYNRDIRFGGLVGFRITARRSGLPERYVKKQDAVYQHEIDFNDDYAGVSPAEVAINEILTGIEMSLTKKSFMENRAVPNWIAGAMGDSPHQQPEQEDADRLTKLLQSMYKGSRNAGRTLVDRFRWQFTNLTMDWDKIKFTDQYADMYEAVAIAFDMPIALIRESASNYAQAEVARRDWGHSWLMRRCEWYGETFTEQVLKDPSIVRRYGTSLVCKPNFDDVMMLKEDDAQKVNKVNAQVQGGYRDLYTAAIETGVKDPPETLKGMYMWGSVPTPISVLPDLWKFKQLVAPSVFNSELVTGEPLPQPVDPNQVVPTNTGGEAVAPNAQPQLPDVSKDASLPPVGKPINIMIGLPNDAELIGLQNRLKQLYASTQVNWLTPDKFHVSLINAPAVPDEQIAMIKEALDNVTWVDDMTLPIGSLRSFDKLGEYAIHFSLRTNSDLSELQQELADLCVSLGIQLGTYSKPEAYKPHITMGYATTKPTPIIFQSKIRVQPQTFVLSVNMETIYKRDWVAQNEPPPEPAKTEFLPDDVFKELKVAAKKADFKPDKLPVSTLSYIKMLKSEGYEGDVLLTAAKSFTVSVLARKAVSATQRDFEREFDALMEASRANETTRRAASGKLRFLLSKYIDIAFQDGLIDGGVDELSVTAEDKDVLAKVKSDQSPFVSSFLDTLFKGDGISDDQAVYKASQWWNLSVYPAYQAGLESAANDNMFVYKLGKTEKHCESCLALDGQRHRYSAFKQAGCLPRGRRLICGAGGLCDCDLVPDAGKEKGSLESVPLVGSARSFPHDHDHEHEHEPENVDLVSELAV